MRGQAFRRASSLAAILMCCSVASGAQILIDRVLARVNGLSVTLSDVRAGLAMGLLVAKENELALATEQWIQRQLLLLEVERFPPAEPEPVAVDQEESRMRSQMGSLQALVLQTGLDDRRIRQSARDTLRIRAYLDQRFGTSVQVSDEQARAYYAAHVSEFTRAGAVVPYEQVEAVARERASAARRQATVDQWMSDLRQRADVVMTPQR